MGEEIKLVKPIVLLGAGRSGTTMLAMIFRKHPELAYWGEPRPVWMTGHDYQDHDELEAKDATSKVREEIRRQFANRVTQEGKTRFVEKTPSNCLRLAFVNEVLPDAKIIHILRDGRDVVRSALRERSNPHKGGIPSKRLSKRIREIPVHRWPAYLPLFVRSAFRTRFLKQQATFWGPRPIVWREWLDLPPHIQAARQWRFCIEKSRRDAADLPADRYLEVHYEDLISNPIETMARLLAFSELSESAAISEHVATKVNPDASSSRHDPLPAEILREIEPEIGEVLADLGYDATFRAG